MNKLINNYWFKLLLAPTFTIVSLGLWALPEGTSIIFIDFLLFMVGGLFIWVIAVKKFLERDK